MIWPDWEVGELLGFSNELFWLSRSSILDDPNRAHCYNIRRKNWIVFLNFDKSWIVSGAGCIHNKLIFEESIKGFVMGHLDWANINLLWYSPYLCIHQMRKRNHIIQISWEEITQDEQTKNWANQNHGNFFMVKNSTNEIYYVQHLQNSETISTFFWFSFTNHPFTDPFIIIIIRNFFIFRRFAITTLFRNKTFEINELLP